MTSEVLPLARSDERLIRRCVGVGRQVSLEMWWIAGDVRVVSALCYETRASGLFFVSVGIVDGNVESQILLLPLL